ncbi:hypothetical protein ACEPAG_6644 [Sanghuangporus baumii]
MALASLFRCRCAQSSGQDEKRKTLPACRTSPRIGRGLPLLWPWVADANRSKLSGITLAHVLSGDTISPISFPEFEAFLAFCDISLENLQFIVWYQDYRKRFEALSPEEQALSPSPHVSGDDEDAGPVFQYNPSSGAFKSSEYNQPNTSSYVSRDPEYGKPEVSKSRSGTTPLSLDICPDILAGNNSRRPPLKKTSSYSDTRPFYSEVQNILATFFVPSSRKELSLSSEMRDTIIKESSRTTHPDVFALAYETIYETVEYVSLPRFLENASTNINRPRQLFWYFSALPFFLLVVAIALLFILSSSERFVVPPQSHRAWRLFSVPCFLLSSMMWYKGFRGFCPILFLRSSRQLRPWELEQMIDDKEVQAYCISLSKEPLSGVGDTNKIPLTPITSSSFMSNNARIAPFLDAMDNNGTKENGIESDVLSMSAYPHRDSATKERDHDYTNEQSSQRARNEYQRPPIFGPGRVVEDKRIRAVHIHLWWSLVRFGLFWATVSAAVVLAVPSLH